MKILEALFAAGFRPVAIPPYDKALCMRRGDCVAVLSPIPQGGLRLLAPPSYLIDGNVSVKLKRGSAEVFVWKMSELAATPERLHQLAEFRRELSELLEKASAQ